MNTAELEGYMAALSRLLPSPAGPSSAVPERTRIISRRQKKPQKTPQK